MMVCSWCASRTGEISSPICSYVSNLIQKSGSATKSKTNGREDSAQEQSKKENQASQTLRCRTHSSLSRSKRLKKNQSRLSWIWSKMTGGSSSEQNILTRTFNKAYSSAFSCSNQAKRNSRNSIRNSWFFQAGNSTCVEKLILVRWSTCNQERPTASYLARWKEKSQMNLSRTLISQSISISATALNPIWIFRRLMDQANWSNNLSVSLQLIPALLRTQPS